MDITLNMAIYAVNYKLFWEYFRCAVTFCGSETIIFLMQLHLPYLFLGLLPTGIFSFKIIGNYLFCAAAVLEIFRINFA